MPRSRPWAQTLVFAARTVSTLAVIAGAIAVVSAHRRDELLQAARIDLTPDAVTIELDLTPGIDVATSIVATIDHDGDGSFSSGEQAAYADRVLAALEVKLDDAAPLPLRLVSSTFPDPSMMRRGEGIIRLRVTAIPPRLSAGQHQLSFKNAHAAGHSVYLANALVPENARMSVTAQRRDGEQTELKIDYTVRGGSTWWEANITMHTLMPGVLLIGVLLAVTIVVGPPRRRA